MKPILCFILIVQAVISCNAQMKAGNPVASTIYRDSGDAKEKLGDYQGAIQYYNKAVEFTGCEMDYEKRGMAKAHLKDYFGAIQDYNLAIANDNNYVKLFFYRGIAKAHLEDYRGAIQDYNKVIELEKEQEGWSYSTDTYYLRGSAKYDIEDKDGACNDWSKAGELGSKEAYDMIKQYCK